MAFTDYLINAIFLVVVLRQARERRLDIRSIAAPMALVVFVATHYVHTIPTGGSDIARPDLDVGCLEPGCPVRVRHTRACRRRRHAVRPCRSRRGHPAPGRYQRRLVFVFALEHGAGPAIRDVSIVHHISAAAWPLALVSMALCEVTARLVIVQVRGQQLVPRTLPQRGIDLRRNEVTPSAAP